MKRSCFSPLIIEIICFVVGANPPFPVIGDHLLFDSVILPVLPRRNSAKCFELVAFVGTILADYFGTLFCKVPMKKVYV